ncbi:MAG: MFS transporter [Armatimonadetes bacterium]|nr:MFS transporter [Armatimonadota bacterium]
MNWDLRIRLSLMMFLQYFIWGGWAVTIYPYLTKALGFSDDQAGWVFSVFSLACIVSPFVGGQIADRYVPTQWFLAACHLLGGAAMFMAAQQRSFPGVLAFMVVYSLLYAPTLALTNSLAFHHLNGADREFGSIRVCGTVGWIAAGYVLTVWRTALPSVAEHGDMLLMSGVGSVALGLFCLALPHTPPRGEAENPLAFVEAVGLLKHPSFLIFMLISFVVTTELQFYYMPTADFLVDLGKTQEIFPRFTVTQENVAGIMTIAQIAEIVAMAALLPFLLPRIGIRRALAIGVIAWPLRYIVFALGQPLWLVVASLALHGIGYTFFFVVSQIYVNRVAPVDIRASAQALLTLVTLGIGNFLGTMFTKWILGQYAILDAAGKIAGHHWTPIFLIPCALTVICAIAFLLGFRDKRAEAPVPAEALA